MLPTEFTWEVVETGYDWIEAFEPKTDDAPRKSGKYLTDDWSPELERLRARRYRPIKEFSGLFRIFAETEMTVEGVKAFADRFGLLLGPAASIVALPHRPPGAGYILGRGETLAAWSTAIVEVRQAVDLWEAARRRDLSKLERHISWTDNGVRFVSHPELKEGKRPKGSWTVATIASPDHRGELFETLTRGDLIKPALAAVQRTVNENLRALTAPQLLWNDARSDLMLHLVPTSLLGAIWLQFAGAIERDNEFRKCAECGTWFELTPQTARSDKIYCSNACRTKAYRRRQAEAIRLHDEGRSAKAIAEALNADIEVVQGWLKRGGRSAAKGRRQRE